MASLETKFNKNEVVFLKYAGKIFAGNILCIDATLAVFEKQWWVKYDIQTGEDSGICHIPEEHLFRTREEAEADKVWASRAIVFHGHRV